MAPVFAFFALSRPALATCQEGCLTSQNTVLGDDALSNTTGANNTAIGFEALSNDTTGVQNTAIGASALFSNTIGSFNTALGYAALSNLILGVDNTAIGGSALTSITNGSQNTAVGYQALFSNIKGSFNTAVGDFALQKNKANNNTATGLAALGSNVTGFNNAANGSGALGLNTTGNSNTADGYQALVNNTTGGFNIALGNNAGGNLTTGMNNIDIGNSGFAGESNTIRIGNPTKQTNAYIAGISGVPVAGGVGVIIDGNGHLGTIVSSERFKDGIEPMAHASEAILALKPVTFRYKQHLDPQGIPQFGLVAEEVEKVNPDLVMRDDKGKPFTVRYEAVNAMLLNEFLKQHRKVEEQQVTITALKSALAEQQKAMKALAATVKEQTVQLQKVNARLEKDHSASRLVVNE